MNTHPDEQEASALQQEDQIRQRRIAGLELDALCAGRNTVFLPVSAQVSRDVQETLDVTAYHIPVGTSSSIRKKELTRPREIPIDAFNPNYARAFWKRVKGYAEQHDGDTFPRLFSTVLSDDIAAFHQSKQVELEIHDGDPNIQRQLNIPAYIEVKNQRHITPELFRRIRSGDAQGLILNSRKQVDNAHTQWEKFLGEQDQPSLLARPFFGLKGTTSQLLEYMHGNATIDTLVFTDSPDLDAAKKIRKLRLRGMKNRKSPKKLLNPFNNPQNNETIRIAVINVQGSARRDAIALLEAAAGIHDYNVEIYLVENGDQLDAADPHGIVLPGGWHKNQFIAQDELGINNCIVTMSNRTHMLALCAGSIQARAPHSTSSRIKSENCAEGTALGIFDYQIVNNVLSNPHDVLFAMHKDGNPRVPTSYVLKDIPFSNGPYMHGVNLETLEVIARLSTTSHAEHIDDDDGDIVGVQVRNEDRGVPVHMAFSFHDKMVFALFLHEIGVFNTKVRQWRALRKQRSGYRERELTMAGFPPEREETTEAP